jgi:hypothetical protein
MSGPRSCDSDIPTSCSHYPPGCKGRNDDERGDVYELSLRRLATACADCNRELVDSFVLEEKLVDASDLTYGLEGMLRIMAYDSSDEEKVSPRRLAMLEFLLDERDISTTRPSEYYIYNTGSIEVFKVFIDRGRDFEPDAHDIFP